MSNTNARSKFQWRTQKGSQLYPSYSYNSLYCLHLQPIFHGQVFLFVLHPISFACLPLQAFTIVISHTAPTKWDGLCNFWPRFLGQRPPKKAPCGGRHITAFITKKVTPQKTLTTPTKAFGTAIGCGFSTEKMMQPIPK